MERGSYFVTSGQRVLSKIQSAKMGQIVNELRSNWPKKIQIFLLSVYYAIIIISQASGQQRSMSNSNQINQRTLTADQQMAMALLTSGKGHDFELMPYKCAQHCSCSLVQTLDNSKGSLVNLTRASCKSSLFSDVLTIDRRTHIIHISLPQANEAAQQQQQPTGSSTIPDSTEQPANTKKILNNSKRKQQIELMTKLLNINVTEVQQQPPVLLEAVTGGSEQGKLGADEQQRQQQRFRMPRLMQFKLLREIVIVNLRIEVCDSEIFKRNQRLLKLKWNFNQLKQVSKSCFRHLDKLLELNLDHNQLDELESALFSPLASLRHLSLAHNHLSELTAHQFANLTRLQSLNLVSNSFKVINLNLFEPMASTLQLLVLAKNQIRQFVVVAPANATNSLGTQVVNPLTGVMFRNLIKLNVDFNKFERVKLLQLHRFFNVKFLSMRGNNIATIRDKAFNGLKLVELNLSQNKLASISRCAFCNSTIKRLSLAENNISTLAGGGGATAAAAGGLPHLFPVASPSPDSSQLAPTAQQLVATLPEVTQQPLMLNPPASSASMLVLSQSILGPLFGHLEYLDLSENRQLANQLEFLLEPLLELQYLNLAATGLDRVLPTPTLFKNLRRLRYLNLSMNHLDQVVAETIEPLVELELLDLSQNDFSELDESFLVVMDELPMLKFVNLASNPWYCSQCKISALYDWISRSSIYNATCLVQQQQQQQVAATSSSVDQPLVDQASGAEEAPSEEREEEEEEESPLMGQEDTNLGFIYRQRASQTDQLARGPHDYSLHQLEDTGDDHLAPPSSVDFDLILDLFEGDTGSTGLLGALDETLAGATPPASSVSVPNYQLVPPSAGGSGSPLDGPQTLVSQFRDKKRQLSERLLKSLASPEDDRSMSRTIASLLAGAQLVSGQLEPEASEFLLKSYFGQQVDFCLKCEFPSELRSFNLHELAPADFKYCAGSAPRFAASEPKIGLTLAIVIIGALFVVIIVVIVIYRKKSNTYYPGEDLAEQLEAGGQQQQTGGGGGMKKPVLSISSDVEHQYGDNTDYSSPPMSQSYSGEESYTERSGSQDPEDQEVDLQEDEEDLGEEEYDDDDDEEEEEEEEDEFDEDDDDYDEDGDGQPDAAGGEGPSEGTDGGGKGSPPSHRDNHNQHNPETHSNATHPKARFEEEETQTETGKGNLPPSHNQHQAKSTSTSTRQPSRELSMSASRSRSTTSGGGAGNLITPSPHASSSTSGSIVAGTATSNGNGGGGSLASKQASLTRSQGSQLGNNQRIGRSGHNDPSGMGVPPPKQMTHNDRDDSTPIYIGPRSRDSAGASNLLSPNLSLDRAAVSDAPTPASLSAGDLLLASTVETTPTEVGGSTPGANNRHHKRGGHKLVQLASLAGSLHESHTRAMTRAQRANEQRNANEENSRNSASSFSRSESRPPPPESAASATSTIPKTILHHHIQHRHSSESHVGPVSFAPTTNLSNNNNNNRHGQDGQRRDRLQRTSQTICVDQMGATSVRNHEAKSTAGPTGGGSRTSGGTPARTRHQMTTLATSSGHERAQHTGAPSGGRHKVFVSQASNGRTLVDFTRSPQTPTPTIMQPNPSRPPPSVVVAKTNLENIKSFREDVVDLMEFARDSTTPSNSETPSSVAPFHAMGHITTSKNNDSNPSIRSDKTSKQASRQMVALRGRPLIKQPHPQMQPSPPQGNHQAEQQIQQQIIRFDDENNDGCGVDQGGEDSFDVEAQLAELPSDLDETDLDQMLADGPPSSFTGGGGGGTSRGALELDQEDEFPADEENQSVNLAHQHHNNNNMRNSHSTHSALTQTGSRDFEL